MKYLFVFLFASLSLTYSKGQVRFESSTPSQTALSVEHSASTGTSSAIRGMAISGFGVYGRSMTNIGVYGSSDSDFGVYGLSTSCDGVRGQSSSGIGVLGISFDSIGVYGFSSANHGAYFSGKKADGFADIILGAKDGSGAGDNGVIMSDPDYPDSDIILISNDAVVIELDNDNNQSGNFIIKAGDNSTIFQVEESGIVRVNGGLVHSSDRNRKEQIINLIYQDILEAVAAMPVYEWQYKGQDRRHIGPMAQDFLSAFGLGEDDTGIASIDEHGVALAAIKALHMQNMAQQTDIDMFKKEIAELKTLLKSELTDAGKD